MSFNSYKWAGDNITTLVQGVMIPFITVSWAISVDWSNVFANERCEGKCFLVNDFFVSFKSGVVVHILSLLVGGLEHFLFSIIYGNNPSH